MGWLNMLYETYQNMSCSELYDDLLPVAHTTQQAQIEVTVNHLGEYVSASVVPKEDAETVIPCTEQSAGRAGSHPVNHPLMDKLQYVAGDYTEYGGDKGASFHEEYMVDLAAWCESEYSNQKVKILYQYLKKGCLISDLVHDKILYCDENNKLMERYSDKANAPKIFKVIPGSQSDAFVRFNVKGFDDQPALWEDKKLRQDYIDYYLSIREGNDLCYILGENTSCSINHPSKLRNSGDMAKLISANDTTGFTFRGRFLSANEAAGISYEVSQGAHNVLKWLIKKKQGKNYGGRVYILWNPKGYELPNIDDSSIEALLGICEKIPYTAKEFAEQFHKAMSGYRARLHYNDQVIIMGIDAATVGRMAITFYREERANELIDNLEYWHNTCGWRHNEGFTKEGIPKDYYGVPSPRDIALAAFGTERSNYLEMDDKLKKNTVERIYHCIIDRSMLPYDIMNATYINICRPQNYKNLYTWRKVLSIGCSLIKKYYYDHSKEDEREEWTVEVNDKEDSLPYLCGRLLAVADALERKTFSHEDKDSRSTAAMKYFTKFVEHPCQTWETINRMLQPYLTRLGGKAFFYQKLMGEISSRIDPSDFLNAKNLDGRMALGYYSQIYTLKNYKSNEDTNNNNDEDKED